MPSLPRASNRERLLIALQTVTEEECGSLLHIVEERQRARRENTQLQVADTIPAPSAEAR